MTDLEIMNIFKNCWFDTDDEICDDINFYNGIIKNIDLAETDFTYATGATKAVIVLLKEDFVIKIPFNCDYDYTHFTEAPYGEDDYCNGEVEIYKLAVEEGLQMFFPEMRWIGNHHDVPFYVQEKVKEAEYITKTSKKNQKIRDSYKSCKGFRENATCTKWIADATEWYGKELVERLMEFIFQEDINDIHSSNIGYRMDGAPIILDYAGFHD